MKSLNNVLQGSGTYTENLLNGVSGLLTVMIMCFVSACASTVRFTPVDFCSQPVNPAMARIVVTRSSSFVGGAVAARVFDNEQPIGDIGNGGRLCWDRFPGLVVLTGELNGQKGRTWVVRFAARANTTYYVRATTSRQSWELVPEENSSVPSGSPNELLDSHVP